MANTGTSEYGNLSTTGSGTISVTATAGQITMDDGGASGTSATTASGSITYLAGGVAANGSVLLSQLASTSGNISVTSTNGAITDNTALETANLSTSGLASLYAATGIGGTAAAADINTAVGSLTASNTTSGQIVINQISSGGALVIAATNTNSTTGGVVNLASGQAVIVTTALGTLTVNGAVSAAGSGVVLLKAGGSAGTSQPDNDG